MLGKMNTIWVLMLYLTSVYCQGPPPPPPSEKEKCVVMMKPGITVRDDETSKAFISTDLKTMQHDESTTNITGYMDYKMGIPNNTMVSVVIQKEKSGRLEVMFSHDICDICKEIGNPDSDYISYMTDLGFLKCPIGPGVYPISNMVVDMAEVELSKTHEGSYNAILTLYENPDGSCQNEKIELASIECWFDVECWLP